MRADQRECQRQKQDGEDPRSGKKLLALARAVERYLVVTHHELRYSTPRPTQFAAPTTQSCFRRSTAEPDSDVRLFCEGMAPFPEPAASRRVRPFREEKTHGYDHLWRTWFKFRPRTHLLGGVDRRPVDDALNWMGNARIDVAVLDYALADRNSDDLQSVLESRKIPFVVVTAYPRVLVRRSDNQKVLSKPISPTTLCESVRAACR